MNYVALLDWDKTVRFGGYVLFDFRCEQAGKQIIELMTQTIRTQKIHTKDKVK